MERFIKVCDFYPTSCPYDAQATCKKEIAIFGSHDTRTVCFPPFHTVPVIT